MNNLTYFINQTFIHNQTLKLINQNESNQTKDTLESINSLTMENKYHWGLLTLIIIMALVLFIMMAVLILPKSVQDSLLQFCFRQTSDSSFNYIDVGLYKTRHSIYRKEIYSLMLGRKTIKPNNIGLATIIDKSIESDLDSNKNEDDLVKLNDKNLDPRPNHQSCSNDEVKCHLNI